ncbi:MAG TPA: AIR synthase related protein, partial [Ktedonobacterales bacterium]|nr:AIR synthase related protein [Ktedonobacterales bacterium]
MPALAVGKLPPRILERLLGKLAPTDPRVVMGPRLGEDAAVLDMGDRYLVATADPITFATDEAGWYALHVNANDIAVRGARPMWFLATVLLPEGAATEAAIERLFADLGEACAELGVALIGGHTEVTAGLPRAIVSGCML